MTNIFSEITFAPETKEMTIKNGTATVAGPFDLSCKAVKVKVTKDANNDLNYETETTTTIGGFATDGYVCKMRFEGATNNASMLFGNLSETWDAPLGNSSPTFGHKDEFSAIVIGAEDIRNNRNAPKALLVMQDQVLSFEIDNSNNLLNVRYHDTIN